MDIRLINIRIPAAYVVVRVRSQMRAIDAVKIPDWTPI